MNWFRALLLVLSCGLGAMAGCGDDSSSGTGDGQATDGTDGSDGDAGPGSASGSDSAGDDGDAVDDGPVTGAILDTPFPDESECDYLMPVLAHGSATPGDTSAFEVPLADTAYRCFYFKPPWGDKKVHGLGVRPVLDDTRVIHHFVLGQLDKSQLAAESGAEDGVIQEDCFIPPGGSIGIWAPGTPDIVMPDGVGLELPSGDDALISLQIHYSNPVEYDDAADRSGFEICATEELQEQTAAVHYLGRDLWIEPSFEDPTLDGECENTGEESVTIMNVMPHMHLKGRHMKIDIVRADGGIDVVHDHPFDFLDEQVYWQDEVQIHPGDVMRTTCTFDPEQGPIQFGARTQDEMCYNFMLAYPVGQLTPTMPLSLDGVVLPGEPHRCVGQDAVAWALANPDLVAEIMGDSSADGGADGGADGSQE